MARGTRTWGGCYNFRIPLVGAPLIQARGLVVALYDNTIRTLDVGNGALRRQETIGARPAAAPLSRRWAFWCRLTSAELGILGPNGKPLPRVPTANPATTAIMQDVFVLPDASARGNDRDGPRQQPNAGGLSAGHPGHATGRPVGYGNAQRTRENRRYCV